MKSLSDYVKENLEIKQLNESSIKFNFDGMDNTDELLKQLNTIQSASVNEKEVEVLCDANVEELKKIYDILKKYSDGERNSHHRTNNEQYAQKTLKIEDKVNELKEMIEKIEKPEDQTADKDPKEEKSDNNKKEEE